MVTMDLALVAGLFNFPVVQLNTGLVDARVCSLGPICVFNA